MSIIWKKINHPWVVDGYIISTNCEISTFNNPENIIKPTEFYHSSNGFDYVCLVIKDDIIPNSKQTFIPVDNLMAMAFIPVSRDLVDKRIMVEHINGDNRDSSLSNLRWVERQEITRHITYPGVKRDMYSISSNGSITNIMTGKQLSHVLHQGYIDVRLQTIDGSKSIRLHRLLAHEFVSNPNNSECVNHINGDKHDYSLKNLEWVSHSENTLHAYLVGLKHRYSGELNPNSKITNNQSNLIKSRLIINDGNVDLTYKDLINEIPELTKAIIHNIKRQLLCNDDIRFNTIMHKKSDDVVTIISKLLMRFNKDISLVYNELIRLGITDVSKSYISKIKNKYIHSDISNNFF